MPMLKIGRRLVSREGQNVRIDRFIASGGQGEVYEVDVEGRKYALKWYFTPVTPEQEQRAEEQRSAFAANGPFSKAPPDPRFLWPLSLVEDPNKKTFGYLMDLLQPNYQGLEKLVLGKMKPSPSFRILCKAAINLAECFRKLHAQGLCYKDINLGGPLLDPRTGDIVICDCDNVRYNKTPGNIIFIFFAAPELIRNEGDCRRKTDWHSLAVLLFYMFIRHHPLDGARELKINVFNEVAQREFYGRNPIFIFDPENESNRPVRGFHDNAIRNWEIYPSFLRRLFTRAFTNGLHNPDERVKEGEWISAFSRLRDCLYYCSHCSSPNFFDFEALRNGQYQNCWRCDQASVLPIRLEIGDRTILFNHEAELFPHHMGVRLDFSKVIAKVSQHPKDPKKWGLQNLSDNDWNCTTSDGRSLVVPPKRTLPLLHGLRIQFGSVEGQLLSR